MNECTCFGQEPIVFPKRPFNRPALDRIEYRIATYAGFRAAMLRRLNLTTELRDWTHREPDDPGIALLESAAIVGDILTFYQELYANEAYLRTAQWRESVAELVRLLGYRLAPGLGGSGAFAIEVKGTKPVTIPAGFGIQADLQGSTEMAEFETTNETVAFPDLSRFHLYRPRIYSPVIPAGTSQLELASVAGKAGLAAAQGAGLKAGDRVMLVPDESMWSTDTEYAGQIEAQIVKLTKVTAVLDRTILEFSGSLMTKWIGPVRAFRVGRTFRHFGHNAPPMLVEPVVEDGKVTGSKQSEVVFDRNLIETSPPATLDLTLARDVVPLDREVPDLLAGSSLIVQGWVRKHSFKKGLPDVLDLSQGISEVLEQNKQVGLSRHVARRGAPLTVVRTIRRAAADTKSLGNLTGSITSVEFTDNVVSNSTLKGPDTVDIRYFQIHEVTSPLLQLSSVADFVDGPQTDVSLRFFGTHAQVRQLAGRRLFLQHDDARLHDLTCVDAAASFVPVSEVEVARLWTIRLSAPPAGYLAQDFDEASPKVTVFGNIVDATQGKTEQETPLGNGDNRQKFQTFKLPKAPLTYLATAGVPPQAPELEIRVNGVLWKRVDSFFGRGPADQIYIVREDANGDSFVQFGDGRATEGTGARLPSGIDNVTAHFRTGNAAHGVIKPGAKPQPGGQLDRLEKIQLPGVISGGAEAESAGKARDAAPGRVQSLGRLVSLRDFETETLGIAGVTKAAAAWEIDGGVPSVLLTVLLAAGRAKEITAVKQTIAKFQHCRGPNRFPVRVIHGMLRYIYLDVQFTYDPRLKSEQVAVQIRQALGAGNDDLSHKPGLFTVRGRRFGEREYASRVAAFVQNVSGVRWCQVTSFGLFPPGEDATEFDLPPDPKPLWATVPCGSTEVLQLSAAHLQLVPVAPPTVPCES